MKIGTKSVLFGAHQFLIHPLFVAIAWWKLYGFPFDPRLWLSFFVHDLGYIGKSNIDGSEGDLHPYFGATIMGKFFGQEWYIFCLYHSRYLAKRQGKPFSKLCVADKLSVALEPWWLYLPRVIISREIHEFIVTLKIRKKLGEPIVSTKQCKSKYRQMFSDTQDYLLEWVKHHKDKSCDSWTPIV